MTSCCISFARCGGQSFSYQLKDVLFTAFGVVCKTLPPGETMGDQFCFGGVGKLEADLQIKLAEVRSRVFPQGSHLAVINLGNAFSRRWTGCNGGPFLFVCLFGFW